MQNLKKSRKFKKRMQKIQKCLFKDAKGSKLKQKIQKNSKICKNLSKNSTKNSKNSQRFFQSSRTPKKNSQKKTSHCKRLTTCQGRSLRFILLIPLPSPSPHITHRIIFWLLFYTKKKPRRS